MPASNPPAPHTVPDAVRQQFASRLVAWQMQHGRHRLPWQMTRDPYRVWLSEIMLQQTQVATVLGYYERFLARFATVQALADAPLDDVLAAWAGLGYYSRARNLHKCAQAVRDLHGGAFPPTAAQLETLPGIGRSTAAAIAAFCFGERAAILDGNVKRVLTRVLGFGDDLSQARHERQLWAMAEALLPGNDIGPYTQGLMDLGATVCLARSPSCLLCPVQTICAARALGRPEAFPVKTRKLKRTRRENWWLWLEHEDAVWLVQRPDTGVWAGLYCLPEYESEEAVEAASRALMDQVIEVLPCEPIQHALTHFDWCLRPLRVQLSQRIDPAAWGTAPGQWVSYRELARVGLPSALSKLLAPRAALLPA